jgi:hypothetical protein
VSSYHSWAEHEHSSIIGQVDFCAYHDTSIEALWRRSSTDTSTSPPSVADGAPRGRPFAESQYGRGCVVFGRPVSDSPPRPKTRPASPLNQARLRGAALCKGSRHCNYASNAREQSLK